MNAIDPTLASVTRYLATLGCDVRTPSMASDGARMHRVPGLTAAPEAGHGGVPDVERHATEATDGHFVVIACDKHDDHHGHRTIAQILPKGWVCFAQFASEAGFSAFHYGPPLPKETTP